jgi:hypothetical protein
MLRLLATTMGRIARASGAVSWPTGLLLIATCAERAEEPELAHSGAHRLAEATCEWLTACDCGGAYPDIDSCTSRLVTILAYEHAAALEGSLHYDEDCERDFIRHLEAGGCSPIVERRRCGDRCRLFHGSGELGAACRWYGNYSDCSQGLDCARDPAGANVCVLACPDEPGVGDPCPDGRCPDGALCHHVEQVCIPIPGIGEPCDLDCTQDAFCPAEPSDDRVCEPRRDLGEPCERHFSCRAGLWCDSFADAPTCFEPPKAGEPCWHEACGEGLFCDGTLDNPSCVPLLQPGEPCTSSEACELSRCCEGYCVAFTAAVCGLAPWSGPSEQGMTPAGVCNDPT